MFSRHPLKLNQIDFKCWRRVKLIVFNQKTISQFRLFISCYFFCSFLAWNTFWSATQKRCTFFPVALHARVVFFIGYIYILSIFPHSHTLFAPHTTAWHIANILNGQHTHTGIITNNLLKQQCKSFKLFKLETGNIKEIKSTRHRIHEEEKQLWKTARANQTTKRTNEQTWKIQWINKIKCTMKCKMLV